MLGRLAGKRILVIEDEYFIASDLRRELEKEEAIVIGPVANLAKGLSLAATQPIDAAVLDVNLEGATSFSIADRLRERETPYLFLTGYDEWALPAAYRAAPRVSKPFLIHTLITSVERLVAREAVS